MSTRLRRAASGAAAEVVGAAVMATGTTGAADAETTRSSDKSHDQPAFIDLTKIRFTYGHHRYVAKVNVRDLKWRGSFSLHILINGTDQAYGVVRVRAHRTSKTVSTWTGWYDPGTSKTLKECHPKVRFKPGKDVVRISVSRDCFPWKLKTTQFTVESTGSKNGNFHFDDIAGSVSYD